jgi:hypothetical protein
MNNSSLLKYKFMSWYNSILYTHIFLRETSTILFMNFLILGMQSCE